MITKWTPENVKNMARKIMLSHAEDAGKFVETDARKRLNAIKDPDTKRDINYRNYLSRYILTNTVSEGKNEIVIRVGMKIGKDGQKYHGLYIELGSSTAEAHPYLRPAVFNNGRDIVRLLGER
jgi:hypothetical protein